ncbi:hypothetical protein NA57DRAFT_71589 [Rhizodiscina lignyota]|uniref:Uncharacterized protein n=1 Tax=Rhizodiscina lignyota TaxID=1504668 RepID=A0A9P4INR0_9PEZI|nr:hypothetical protein NA57DRAFT_71589 [Rhizodiscina lignyota]
MDIEDSAAAPPEYTPPQLPAPFLSDSYLGLKISARHEKRHKLHDQDDDGLHGERDSRAGPTKWDAVMMYCCAVISLTLLALILYWAQTEGESWHKKHIAKAFFEGISGPRLMIIIFIGIMARSCEEIIWQLLADRLTEDGRAYAFLFNYLLWIPFVTYGTLAINSF